MCTLYVFVLLYIYLAEVLRLMPKQSRTVWSIATDLWQSGEAYTILP